MNKIAISNRKIGVNFNEGKTAEILLWSPFAKDALLYKTETEEKIAMECLEYGYWGATTNTLKPGDAYKFIISTEKEHLERPDPASLLQKEGVHGASTAFDLNAHQWADSGWKGLPLSQYIFYELHAGTFSPAGNFEGVAEKLDHLVELGVTAIELMPVAQFPGARNWGYDGVYPFAAQGSYGGPAALQHLVDLCHQKGLAVVLDVVYNHMGPEGNYFGDFGPYFTDKYHTPWGSAINFDDAWSDGVRNYFIENVLMWLRDFHIDALRMDAVHAIKDFGAVHILTEIRQHVDQLKGKTGRNHYLIIESDLNDSKYINPLKEQGYGMDAQWIDEFHHALRVTAGEERTGYYSDFDGIGHLEKSYKDAYVFDGIYSPHRFKTFGNKAENNPGQQFVVFSQNHDHVGNRMLGERTSVLVSMEMQKLLAGAVLCSPYLPMLFMGEEWSETNPFLYFVSHTDQELADAVRKGRKAEFKAFHSDAEAPDPVDQETFNRSKLQWGLLSESRHQTMFNYYKHLISIRKRNAALNNLDRKQIRNTLLKSKNCLMVHRWHEEQHVLCLLNFSNEKQDINIPADKPYWKKLLYSAEQEWGGSGMAPNSVDAGESITLQPESFLIYTSKHV